ncbi:MAG: hypothetical protein ACKVOE_06690 [Rickettsiales bacterium]
MAKNRYTARIPARPKLCVINAENTPLHALLAETHALLEPALSALAKQMDAASTESDGTQVSAEFAALKRKITEPFNFLRVPKISANTELRAIAFKIMADRVEAATRRAGVAPPETGTRDLPALWARAETQPGMMEALTALETAGLQAAQNLRSCELAMPIVRRGVRR